MTKAIKQISEHAAAAKMIRAELKSHGINAKVKASSSSMTSSVNVTLIDCPPWIHDKVAKRVRDFEYGSFDGMTDMYVYSSNSDLPQVRYTFVSFDFSDELKQQALDVIADHYDLPRMTLKDAPETLPIISPAVPHMKCYTTEMIRNTLAESQSTYFRYPSFWKKPVKRIMAISA